MAKYVASRRDVCAGQLLKTGHPNFRIFDSEEIEVDQIRLKESGINISVSCGLICRGMLFSVNDDGLANDLVYTTPVNYPISDISSDKPSPFIIENYVELDEVLKYLKYGEDLTQHDLNKIHRTLVSSDKWLKRNRELFGFKKAGIGYSLGGDETLPLEVYKNLDWISGVRCGKPFIEEPGYSYIKKKSFF